MEGGKSEKERLTPYLGGVQGLLKGPKGPEAPLERKGCHIRKGHVCGSPVQLNALNRMLAQRWDSHPDSFLNAGSQVYFQRRGENREERPGGGRWARNKDFYPRRVLEKFSPGGPPAQAAKFCCIWTCLLPLSSSPWHESCPFVSQTRPTLGSVERRQGQVPSHLCPSQLHSQL